MKWTVHGQRLLYTSGWVNLWLEDVEVPGGERFEHHVLRMPRHSVAIVVLDDAGERMLLLWRHRFITDSWGWEIPAGWRDEGEAAIDAARREVMEETGWEPDRLIERCSYYALPGIADLHFTLYEARGATRKGPPSDGSESSRVEWVSVADIPKLIDDGQITDGPSLMGISFMLAFHRGGGTPPS